VNSESADYSKNCGTPVPVGTNTFSAISIADNQRASTFVNGHYGWMAIVTCLLVMFSHAAASAQDAADRKPCVAFVGLHGGIFESLQAFEEEQRLVLKYVRDADIADGTADLDAVDVLLLQHTRAEHRLQYQQLIETARKRHPALKIVSISGLAERHLPELAKAGVIESDEQLTSYYGSTPENLRRMLIYIRVKYLQQPGDVIPAESSQDVSGLFHPDREDMFSDTGEFLDWAKSSGRATDGIPRVCIAVHSTHLVFQQPQVVAALIREFEKQGALAVAMTDYGPGYETDIADFKPLLVVHTCHSRERVPFRQELNVPHVHSIFMRDQSIDQWQTSSAGLTSGEIAFHIVGQELLGAIEPQITSGTLQGGGSEEAFVPVPDRIEHLVQRSMGWLRLATKQNQDKRVAYIYYDREMGKAELMRGSATGMFMNGPRSLVQVLQAMQKDGYSIDRVPESEDQLLAWMMERGRQIGVWAPGVLDRLAQSGEAVLVPAERYRAWFEKHVPEAQRQEVIRRWGEPPGQFLVWEHDGEQFIVIPRIDLGHVILLPQPLRGEAQDTSLVHDLHVPPPHNYLATYFWLQKDFAADAMVHFGTHGSEFMLPGKPTGLSRHDWPDIVMGPIPNINPWVINNLGESSPVRRRAYAVLIDHLVPPSVNAELSDELANLHDDIDKWVVLDEGALKQRFREAITRQVKSTGLMEDCHLQLSEEELLSGAQIHTVLTYLHDIHNETTPTSLHVFGQPPRDDLLIPYLATCMGSDFLLQLGNLIEVPEAESLTVGDRRKYLRARAEEVIDLHVRRGFSAGEALTAAGATLPPDGLTEQLRESFVRLQQLVDGFRQTPQEIEQLLAALDGRFIAPGPGNSPDRNPSALPTGRNMYVMNPEEVPTRPSWELGKQLVDQLLADQLETKGALPDKIAFTLNSFATFQDYGVMESQILYLMGVRPAWNEKNLVTDVQLIALEELGRPRIDVFIAGLSYYRDMLPTRMRLLDRAIRMVADADESPDRNLVRRNSQQVELQLLRAGLAPEQAARQARARIFGYPEGQMGSAGYYYLIEKSGEWDTREQLMDVYLSQVRNVYTEGAWGVAAASAYNEHIQGTDIVLRSWSDRTRSPLSNKYVWYHGGSLALAVKHLTGTEPEFLLSDVRDPGEVSIVRAEDALRQDFRVRLFNRKWIEGMMKEGYAGADQVAVHVSNSMGWTIMRPGSVGDDFWQEIVETYIQDKKDLNIREWFESENPFAYQELNEILLETVRKGYWQPDSQTLQTIAVEYVKSVARHGEGGGLRGGGNHKLEAFVHEVLSAANDRGLDELLTRMKLRSAEQVSDSGAVAAATAVQDAAPASGELPEPETEGASELTTTVEQVEGQVLEPVAEPESHPASTTSPPPWTIILAVACLLLIAGGYFFRWGAPRG
jgi:cobaltochelatase CobN